MAFTSAVIKKLKLGRTRVHFGSFTNGAGDSGGGIDTGMKLCYFLFPWLMKATAITTFIGTDEDFSGGPIAGNAIKIVTALDEDGYWLAVGR